MNDEVFLELDNGQRSVRLDRIPLSGYGSFIEALRSVSHGQDIFPLAYFCEDRRLYAVLMDYSSGRVNVGSCMPESDVLPTSGLERLYQFERDISERSGMVFEGHPYMKPLRRTQNSGFVFDAPQGRMLHEVNVGPVHAGIIEPGRFRFRCMGEKVLSMEVCLGYQNRSIEKRIVESNSNLQRMLLAEQIAGDSVIANSVAMASILENGNRCPLIDLERALALEMERVAMHFADIAALSGDCAYQFGQISVEPLRTAVINLMQLWSGSRSGRSIVRPFGSFCRLSLDMIAKFQETLTVVRSQFSDISVNMMNSPSLLSRLDGKCQLVPSMARRFAVRGTVGKASSVVADVRTTGYASVTYPDTFSPVRLVGGDLLSRLRIRLMEADQSFGLVMVLLKRIKALWYVKTPVPSYDCIQEASSLIVSPVEGFRGTILHAAITDELGAVSSYRIFDPSVIAWPVLAYVMRGQQISDFPLCNKSFNLSYLANDL